MEEKKSYSNHAQKQITLPSPPKTSFMCFSLYKEKEMTEENLYTSNVVKKKVQFKEIADAWRCLTDRERAVWDEEARKDKYRYSREKSLFVQYSKETGTFHTPKKRSKKNPLAPKRPMSAFLRYAQSRRKIVRDKNPDMNNTDVSRLLGEMWRNSSEEKKAPYVQQELHERAMYKVDIAKWRAEQAQDDAKKTIEQSSVSLKRNHSYLDYDISNKENEYTDMHSHQSYVASYYPDDHDSWRANRKDEIFSFSPARNRSPLTPCE